MKSFVFYRMPYAETYVEIEQLDGQPETLQSPLELDGHIGFVVAPYSYSSRQGDNSRRASCGRRAGRGLLS